MSIFDPKNYFDSNYDYYGTLKSGQQGWSPDVSAFNHITDANEFNLFGSEFYNGDGGVTNNAGSSAGQAFAQDSLKGFGKTLFGGTGTGPNGAVTQSMGIVSPMISAFNAWNAYNNYKDTNKRLDEAQKYMIAGDMKDRAMREYDWRRDTNDKTGSSRIINAANTGQSNFDWNRNSTMATDGHQVYDLAGNKDNADVFKDFQNPNAPQTNQNTGVASAAANSSFNNTTPPPAPSQPGSLPPKPATRIANGQATAEKNRVKKLT